MTETLSSVAVADDANRGFDVRRLDDGAIFTIERPAKLREVSPVIDTASGLTLSLPARLPSDESQIIEMRPPSRSAAASR